MLILQIPGEELGDYAPNPYAKEGDLETDLQLGAIAIRDPLRPGKATLLGRQVQHAGLHLQHPIPQRILSPPLPHPLEQEALPGLAS